MTNGGAHQTQSEDRVRDGVSTNPDMSAAHNLLTNGKQQPLTSDMVINQLMTAIVELKSVSVTQERILKSQQKIIENQNNIIGDLRGQVNQQAKTITQLNKTVHWQINKIHELNDKCDRIEQASNSNKVVISGPSITPLISQATVDKETVVGVINRDLCIPSGEALGVNQVNFVRKMNAKQVLIAFNSDTPRFLFKYIRNSERKLFMTDYLTPTRNTILYHLRQIRNDRESPVEVATSRNGRPAFKLKDATSFQFVETMDKLRSIFGRTE